MGEIPRDLFFSAQSLTTVGYGRLNPTGVFDSALASIEAMVGLLGFAVATGLLYGRFSRPVVRLLYSEQAVVAPIATAALMLRVAKSIAANSSTSRQAS